MKYLFSCIIVSITAAINQFTLAASQERGFEHTNVVSYNFTFYTRSQWDARQPKESLHLETSASYVTIHHSYMPEACNNFEECAKVMRVMQDMHMDTNRWWDIGYSFAVGSDGAAYEGRGWDMLGAHALHFNFVSIGICLIGDWTDSLPPPKQLETTKSLIAAGVKLGYIQPDYRLVGHRQVRATECPGDALFNEIKNWHHHSNFPASPIDLVDVQGIPDDVKEKIQNETSYRVMTF